MKTKVEKLLLGGSFVTCLLMLAGQLPRAEAAEIRLRNGDRISGQLVTLVGGSLTVVTDYAGKLEIEAAALLGIEAVGPVLVELATGERLEGTLEAASAGELRIVSAADGSLHTVPLAEVAALNPPPAVQALYSGSVSLAASLQRGNAEQTALTAAAEGDRTTERDRTSFRLRWVDARERERRTARSAFGAVKYAHDFAGRFYAFTGAELLADEFKDLDLRSALNLGVGYRLIGRERLALSLEGGLTYLTHDFIVAEGVDEVTLRLAADLRWSPGRFKVIEHLLVYPSFEEEGVQLRYELSAATEIFAGWAMELAGVLEYDSDPPPGLEKNDLLWTLGLQYGF